ncbi:hypothetical protein HDU76_000420 [Blyttiomyces sp. JEL0837]|nr:hypothetical protein HDU76_000420 [Blyttiomyces sp. JEL0837]
MRVNLFLLSLAALTILTTNAAPVTSIKSAAVTSIKTTNLTTIHAAAPKTSKASPHSTVGVKPLTSPNGQSRHNTPLKTGKKGKTGTSGIKKTLAGTSVNSGQGTYYNTGGTYYNTGGGYGACGVTLSDSTAIVAIAASRYDSKTINGNPNNNAYCGKCVSITGARGTVTATILDRCVSCAYGDLDLTPSIFSRIDDPSKGRVPITWTFCDGSLNGGFTAGDGGAGTGGSGDGQEGGVAAGGEGEGDSGDGVEPFSGSDEISFFGAGSENGVDMFALEQNEVFDSSRPTNKGESESEEETSAGNDGLF